MSIIITNYCKGNQKLDILKILIKFNVYQKSLWQYNYIANYTVAKSTNILKINK